MKNNRTKKGVVLILIIILIAFTGIIMSFLTAASNTMLYQSNTAYLQASERNLIASGLAWSKINLQKESGKTPGEMVELDVTEMNIRGSSLTVKLSVPAENQPQARLPRGYVGQVQIRTSCSRGRKTLTSDKTYAIGP